MQSPELESKRIFLIASANHQITQFVEKEIQKHIKQSTIFSSVDGQEALFKVDNVYPHVVILNSDLTKLSCFEVTEKLLQLQKDHSVSVILLCELPDKEHFIDQVVTRQVQFITHAEIAEKLPQALARALNRVSLEDHSTYRLKFMAAKEILFFEGEKAGSVFIVKTGELAALKESNCKAVVLGRVKAGEFVGEMAHINHEARYATVQALTDCELIEIPSGVLDLVLFSKPAWSQALISTLSRRLKISNTGMIKSISS